MKLIIPSIGLKFVGPIQCQRSGGKEHRGVQASAPQVGTRHLPVRYQPREFVQNEAEQGREGEKNIWNLLRRLYESWENFGLEKFMVRLRTTNSTSAARARH
ncbi:MAG: hypothetical protein OXF88_21980 [Rhodobacteraceae bacterium]|nr:hypothetical protein [Paracoccaceae bacterium]MCY4138353.1 hypothetical protein [Paracoccaceae bacterium]